MPQLHKLAGLVIACAVVIGLLAPAVNHPGERDRARRAIATEHEPGPSARPAAASSTGSAGAQQPQSPSSSAPQTAPTVTPAMARSVRANELGQVPVLMYHRILAKPVTTLDRTPADLRHELERLAKQAYVPVTAVAFAAGRVDIPAGTHPVVLTFDDGDPSHLTFDQHGAPKPETAMGVLLDVARRYPWFRPVATFFVNSDPFNAGNRAGESVRWLVRHGCEVANHTTHHLDLAGAPKKKVAREIGTDQKMIIDLGGVPPSTFAFPYGALSHPSWADHGTGGTVSWDFTGMFLAGWRPADSPFSTDFHAMQIPRVRSQNKIKTDDCQRFCSAAWLDWLENNPDKRFTSDGDPAAISFPSAMADVLATRFEARGRPY